MTSDAEAALGAGHRLFDIVEHGDLEELRDVFADGAVVWHNTDNKTTTVEQTIRNLRALKAMATAFRYVDIRREPTPSGFVQQHTLIVGMPDGTTIHDRCACICRVENGRIAHMDAYHDSASLPSIPGRKAGRDFAAGG